MNEKYAIVSTCMESFFAVKHATFDILEDLRSQLRNMQTVLQRYPVLRAFCRQLVVGHVKSCSFVQQLPTEIWKLFFISIFFACKDERQATHFFLSLISENSIMQKTLLDSFQLVSHRLAFEKQQQQLLKRTPVTQQLNVEELIVQEIVACIIKETTPIIGGSTFHLQHIAPTISKSQNFTEEQLWTMICDPQWSTGTVDYLSNLDNIFTLAGPYFEHAFNSACKRIRQQALQEKKWSIFSNCVAVSEDLSCNRIELISSQTIIERLRIVLLRFIHNAVNSINEDKDQLLYCICWQCMCHFYDLDNNMFKLCRREIVFKLPLLTLLKHASSCQHCMHCHLLKVR